MLVRVVWKCESETEADNEIEEDEESKSLVELQAKMEKIFLKIELYGKEKEISHPPSLRLNYSPFNG